ncbi:hypothetical protein B0T16DRAFT_388712 [Cercophora newfieldiana]|uniref:MYND-type domain-containing protein n=1 Tax=Cercophora newfieldiana TaxID=92897 RepID=A0AA39Y9E9_9PEZI|nr:hypothetical protein B0T16DRAFT_388712 [Cercophora newfieldiana]
MSLQLMTQCGLCSTHLVQISCDGCHVIRYCSAECQQIHRPDHQSACDNVRAAREALEREDATESIDIFCSGGSHITNLVALTVLKLRLRLDYERIHEYQTVS